MKKIILCASLLIITNSTIINLNLRSYTWEFQNLFQKRTFTKKGLKRALEYNTDNDISPLPALEGKNFFQSIDDLSICRRKEIRKFLYIYLTRGREFVKNSIRRSVNYIDIIKKEFEKNPDIPAEIMMLPLLESGFNPRAVSRSRAVGLWQFLGSTSKILGLKNDYWVDERRHIEKSTRAAIRHLKNVYSIFNSWEYTLAAYNGGAGRVKRAMRKKNITNFWELCDSGALSPETAEYVSRFASLLVIYKNQDLFGLHGEIEYEEKIATDTITLGRRVNIQKISKMLNIPYKTIRKLNPEFKRNIVPPYYSDYTVRIPRADDEKIKFSMNDGTALKDDVL